MESTSQWCNSVWKRDINNRRYQKVVVEIWGITELYYREKNREWIKVFENIISKLDDMSDRRIMPHIRKYIKDFIHVAILAIEGKCTKRELKTELNKTLKLLAIAYCS